MSDIAMTEQKELLNMLKSINGTLKRIEQSIKTKKQSEIIKKAASPAVWGEKEHKCNCGKSAF